MNTKPLVSYLRVSTQRQGDSGLGLDGQRNACQNYAQRNGGRLQAEFIETESGRKSDRPKLALAVAMAKRIKGTLIIAKLDRLSRNVAFIASMMDSGVDFVAVDMPTANRLTLHILAAMAEHEAAMISERTKTALAAAKRRGIKLGSQRPNHWRGREHLRMNGLKTAWKESSRLAAINNSPIIAEMKALRADGLTLSAISQRLNDENKLTHRGNLWSAVTVRQILIRY